MSTTSSKSLTSRTGSSRSKTGCLTCRSRHVKCDEGKPICATCRKARLHCQRPKIIHSLAVFSEAPKANDHHADSQIDFGFRQQISWDPRSPGHPESPLSSDRSHLLLPVVGVQPERAPEVNPKTSASLRHDETEIRDLAPSTPPASCLPALDQILVSATEKFHVHGFGHTSSTAEKKHIQHALIDREVAFLLRTYEEGIGAWMDVFDCSSSYRDGLLTLVPSSSLLLHSTCALAARQLSLISCSQTWAPVAERHYGISLNLLSSLLTDPEIDPEHAIVASILLSSYELLKSPNHPNYQQHFRGAKSLVEVLCAYNSPKGLTRASFWIYARHDVGEAMNLECPTMLDPKLWPKADFSTNDDPSPDTYCNDILRISCEVIRFVFGPQEQKQGRTWAKEWLGLQLDLDEWLHGIPHALTGKRIAGHEYLRFWFPRPPLASAMCYYHVSKMFLAVHPPELPSTVVDHTQHPEEQTQYHANHTIDIALSEQPDSVLVTMVQPISHAARHTHDLLRRREAIVRLEDVRVKTGYHTESIVQLLKSLPEV